LRASGSLWLGMACTPGVDGAAIFGILAAGGGRTIVAST
jgi:hypothetical protein